MPQKSCGAEHDNAKLAEIDLDIRKFIEKLRSDNPEERISGVASLDKTGKRVIPAIPYLVKILNDDTFIMSNGKRTSPSRKASALLVKLGEPAISPI